MKLGGAHRVWQINMRVEADELSDSVEIFRLSCNALSQLS